MITPVALPQVLASREARVLRQRRVLAETGWPVVSVTLVAPGPVKDTPAYRSLRDLAVTRVVGTSTETGWVVGAPQRTDEATGPEALVAVQAPPDALKRAMVALEDGSPEGRLLDLDVVAPPTTPDAPLEPLSRSALGLPPRGCLVCERPARECARSSAHPLPVLLDAVLDLLGRFEGPGDVPEPGPVPLDVWAEHLGSLAHAALLAEVHHTPKPGLVDERNTGAHTDMDLALFERSAGAIAPFLPRFVLAGAACTDPDDAAFLAALRPLGVECEAAMFATTGGINTHKGAVFALGLLLSCSGRLLARDEIPDPASACAEAAAVARCTMPELLLPELTPGGTTAGQRLFTQAGLTGARGEAASGYATVREHALPAYTATLVGTGDERLALSAALLELLAYTQDTNLAKDGGTPALGLVREEARAILDDGGAQAEDVLERLESLDDRLIEEGLSPGGCADLLALTWLFAHWPTAEQLGGR